MRKLDSEIFWLLPKASGIIFELQHFQIMVHKVYTKAMKGT